MTDLPAQDLLDWYDRNKREMPWRNTSDPYKIWVSEIMLQQTRVDTAIPYFNNFIKFFPTVEDLANADQQEVLKIWEGLGYYSRARNMHQAAKTVTAELNGHFPDTYEQLIKLKGIGPYTAAAISSIAFGEKRAVVDGNVMRVICRYYDIEDDIRSSRTKKRVQKIVDSVISKERPGDFNQAIMELGATVCTPTNPACGSCPISAGCKAFNMAKTDTLPYKSKKAKVPHHDIAVGIIINPESELLIALRPNDAMLGGLWEFPGGKKEDSESLKKAVKRELHEELGVEVSVGPKLKTIKHAYSHFKITLHAYWCRIQSGTPSPKSSREIAWVPVDSIAEYPFPKANKTLTETIIGLPAETLSNIYRDL